MKSRLVFIDLLRGWATLVMIEVHVFNAFMQPQYRETAWFGVLNYINGLVAPSFIFVAGFVFQVSSQRKLEEFRAHGRAYWNQIVRVLQVLVIGYLLHLPFFSFVRTLHETDETGWMKLYQSDVLQCIALGLLILFFARIRIRSDAAYKRLILAVGLVVVGAAPFLWDIDFHRYLPGPIAAPINGQHYSLFPIFPWLGFMMAGGYSAASYMEARNANTEQAWIKRYALIGAALLAGGTLIMELPLRVPYASLNVRANPFFFLERLGIVFLLLTACWYYAERRRTERSFVLDVSRESLFVYASQLLMIYGMFWHDRSLWFLYGYSFGVWESVAATIGMMLVMVLSAKLWAWLKHEHVPLARGISFATVFLLGYLYFTR